MSSLPNTEKTAFVVLGMHRSGTSSVAGSLVGLGASAPSTLMQPMPDNPLGFWESDPVMHLNDEILAATGSSWHDWSSIDQGIFEGSSGERFGGAALALLESEFGDARTIVLKDPRICRIYPFWRDALMAAGFRPVVVMPVRRPDQVARSLNVRNGLPISLGLGLWLRHTLDAEFASRADTRQITILDDFISHWPDCFARLASSSGIDLALSDPEAVAEVGRFWRRETPGASAPPDRSDLPALVERTWSAFQTLSSNGDTDASRLLMDQARAELDAMSTLFQDTDQTA